MRMEESVWTLAINLAINAYVTVLNTGERCENVRGITSLEISFP